MTRFVPNFSTQQLPPPWVSLGARNWVFAIKVPQKCLQDFLDTHFNCPAPDYAPYFYEAYDYPYGLLRVTKHDNFSSDYGGAAGMRTLRKIDVDWSYPVTRWQVSPENIRFNPQVVWVEPMSFDNNSYSMFSSREIWGTESEMARIAADEETDPPRMHIDVAVQGVKYFRPKSISHLIGVLHIEMNPEVESELEKELSKHPGLASFVGVLFSSVRLSGQADFNHNSEVNTLKQFRDVFNMRVAVYRAIIASRTDHTEVADMKFYDGSKVELDFMWSQTMAEALHDYFGFPKTPPMQSEEGHPGGADQIDSKEIDWNLPRLGKEVVLAASFTSNIRYDILDTLHTYGS
ncbi:hypothetical protein P8Q88_05345 [Qipengyuania sp. XHP0207]|uniref:hypothetical protein n=1 Tax=Qipengyuania sp. XHP0207 TaxID=3038078 RepID=UPI00241D417F|nr:hypothetical protein [Qipengyuania sp. XHP0207]MDG5747600.1 hypothetical protein [Qipengyuania sp. XHP0207]